MTFENTQVYNIDQAIHGIRNSFESWNKEDSDWRYDLIGQKDLSLAQGLIRAGSSHRKFLRQIFVSTIIDAPAYWWAEFDTYKVGTTRNSTSMQHRAKSKPFLLDDFELDNNVDQLFFTTVLTELNRLRNLYIETGDYDYFRAIRQTLPSSYKYMSTVTMTYENVYSMIQQRKNHKLKEWSVDFVQWARSLPQARLLLFFEEEE